MVVAGKIFKIKEPLPLTDISTQLDGYHIEEPYEEGDYNFVLETEVSGLLSKENSIVGVYSHDYVMHVFHRGKIIPISRIVEALFSFVQAEKTTFLTIMEKKRLANFVANKLGEILFDNLGSLVEARIPPETLLSFHLKNPEDTRITFFDNIDIPNVNKLSLYGSDLINARLFEDYKKHGDLWYVVARSKKTGYVVGVARDASVTIFNSTDKTKFLDYVKKEIYPLILESV